MKYGIYLRGFKPYTGLELRESLIRIPEILIELKKIQQVCDIGQEANRDVLTDFLSEEGHLSIAMQKLISASVQKGLVQRAVKRLGSPTFAISSSDSLPLKKFIFEQIEMERFLYEPSVQGIKESDPISPYSVVQLISDEGKPCFETIELQASNTEELAMDLVDHLSIQRLVAVTVPENILQSFYHDAPAGEKLIVQDVIETDPFLGWFDYQMLRTA